MDSLQPENEAPPPEASSRGLQSVQSSSTAPTADKVSSSVLVTWHRIVAKTFKTIIHSATAADMPDQLNMQNSPQQNCPLLKRSTELRLGIYQHVYQLDLDAIFSTPISYHPASMPMRGALALLHTCRTIRTESADAFVPFAPQGRFELMGDKGMLDFFQVRADMLAEEKGKQTPVVPGLEEKRKQLQVSEDFTEKMCGLLARVHGVHQEADTE